MPQTRPLYLSPKLVHEEVCVPMPLRSLPPTSACGATSGSSAGYGTRRLVGAVAHARRASSIRLRQPTPGLQLAYDPRVPAAAQVFEFALQGSGAAARVRWTVDGHEFDKAGPTYRWSVTRGEHRVAAAVWQGNELVASLGEIAFHVK